MDSRPWKTVVPWSSTSGGMGRCTPPTSVRLTLPISVRLSSDVDARVMCTRETSICRRIFAVSALKNLHLMLTARLSLKDLRISTLADLGSARFGRVGGSWSYFAVRGDDPRWDKLTNPSSVVISREFTGGREDLTGGMIGGGSEADGALRRRLDFVGWP